MSFSDVPGWGLALAEHPMLESIREAFSTGPDRNEVLALLAGLAALIGVIAIGARFFDDDRKAAEKDSAQYLAKAIELLGMSEGDRRVLLRIADKADLEQPAAMLLTPANLALALDRAIAAGDSPEQTETVRRICVELFGCPLPPAPKMATGGGARLS